MHNLPCYFFILSKIRTMSQILDFTPEQLQYSSHILQFNSSHIEKYKIVLEEISADCQTPKQ